MSSYGKQRDDVERKITKELIDGLVEYAKQKAIFDFENRNIVTIPRPKYYSEMVPASLAKYAYDQGLLLTYDEPTWGPCKYLYEPPKPRHHWWQFWRPK